jgi:hypothetical protein
MKATLKLVAVSLVVFGISGTASAFTVHFQLDSWTVPGEWTLKAKTDAPGGIASFAVQLQGATTGTSVAPRAQLFGGDVRVFTQGNLGNATTPTWGNSTLAQAFAGQNTSSAPTLVYGLGFSDVPDATLAPPGTTQIGSGIRDFQGFITLYTGTGNAAFALNQPTNPGAVWPANPPANVTPLGVAQGTTFDYGVIIPEPPAVLPALLAAFPALGYLIRVRRKASGKSCATPADCGSDLIQ